MIEIVASCHVSARAEAVRLNGGKSVRISCVYRAHEGAPMRFTFRTSATGGYA